MLREPQQTMMIPPNDGDEQIAHRVAYARRPQGQESRERGRALGAA
jgi:hypothetical protein